VPPAQPNPYAAPGAYGQQPYAPPAQTDGLAIGALVAGILFWPVGIVLSLVALSKIKRTGSGGRGFAIAGLILSIVGFLGSIISVILLVLLATAAPQAVSSLDGSGVIDQSVSLGETGTTSNGIAFTATAVECGIPSVSNSYDTVEADGQFCKVSLTVQNNDIQPFTYSGSYSAAYVGSTEYAPDDEAIYATDEDVSNYEELNPGASVDTIVFFDIPADATITRLVFTEDYSGGSVEITP
jgi:hypothetical protein